MSAFTQLALSSSDSEDDVRSSTKNKQQLQQQQQQQQKLKKVQEKQTKEELRELAFGSSSSNRKKKSKGNGKVTNGSDGLEFSPPEDTGNSTLPSLVSSTTPTNNSVDQTTFSSSSQQQQRGEKNRLQAYENDLEQAIRESLQLQQKQQELSAAASTVTKGSSATKGNKTVLSLQEFHTGSKTILPNPHSNNTAMHVTKPITLEEEENLVKKQVALAVLKEVSRSNLDLSGSSSSSSSTTTGGGSTTKGKAGGGGGGNKKTVPPPHSSDNTSPDIRNALMGSVTTSSGYPLTIDTLPSIASIQADLQTNPGQQKFLQIYLFQLYELQRLQKENEVLKNTVTDLSQQLKDPSTIEKSSLIDELRAARQESQEYIKEITEFHTKESQNLSRIHELENQIFSLQNQLRHPSQHHQHSQHSQNSSHTNPSSVSAMSSTVLPPPGLDLLITHSSTHSGNPPPGFLFPSPLGNLTNTSSLPGLSPNALPGLALGLGVSVMGDGSNCSTNKYLPQHKR